MKIMSLLHKLTRGIRVDNATSLSSFDCNETRVIFIAEYVSTLISVHPASIAVKHTRHFHHGIDEIMIVSIKSYFLSHKGRRPNGRAPKRRRPNAGAQTAAPKRPAPYHPYLDLSIGISGQSLSYNAALVNKLLPCAYILHSTVEVFRSPAYYTISANHRLSD